MTTIALPADVEGPLAEEDAPTEEPPRNVSPSTRCARDSPRLPRRRWRSRPSRSWPTSWLVTSASSRVRPWLFPSKECTEVLDHPRGPSP